MGGDSEVAYHVVSAKDRQTLEEPLNKLVSMLTGSSSYSSIKRAASKTSVTVHLAMRFSDLHIKLSKL